MNNLKAQNTDGIELSSSGKLESCELESAETVVCPYFDQDMKRARCLEYQAMNSLQAASSGFHREMWKACRSGCPNSLIGPEGHPIEREEAEIQKDEGFKNRLKQLINEKFSGKDTLFAKAADLSQSGLRRYLSGGDPTRAKLIAMASAAKVNLLWLATGEGPISGNFEQNHTQNGKIDTDRLRLAIETVEEGLLETRRKMAPDKKAELILAVYDLFTDTSEAKTDRTKSVLRLIKSVS
ncbi:MAG: hypothetical protein ABTQ25_08340 [Nitrosomonas ureae]